MKVLLIQVDGKWPNLALMKLAAWHKAQGDQVYLDRGCDPERVYIGCIFTKNRPKALGIARMFPQSEVIIGGSGVNYEKLPDEIEHTCPDYELFGIKYSMGYTSRGCFRKCPWCLVPRMYGDIHEHAHLDEFIRHDKVRLLDDNFLASSNWAEKLEDMGRRGTKVCFTQGLDIRLVDMEAAKLLSKVQYRENHFQRRRLYFSWDLPEIEDKVIEGIDLLEKADIPARQLMFYVLVGFNTSYDEDLHRIRTLAERGCLPYVMPYNDRKDSYYPHLERWVNRRMYEFIPWEKYDCGESQTWIQKQETTA